MEKVKAEDLITGQYYYGIGRLGNIAMWNGKYFMAFGFDCGRWLEQTMEYGPKGFDPYTTLEAEALFMNWREAEQQLSAERARCEDYDKELRRLRSLLGLSQQQKGGDPHE